MYCRNCGAQLTPGDGFCGSCGIPVSRDAANRSGSSHSATSQPNRDLLSRFPLVLILAGLGGVLVLILLASVTAFALIGRDDRETIEPQPGVFTKLPEGWDVVSSSTPDGTARIPNDEMEPGPTIAPEKFRDMSYWETSAYKGVTLTLRSTGDGCSSSEEFEDTLTNSSMPVLSGYDQTDFASRLLDGGSARVAGRAATWRLLYIATAMPYREVPGDSSTYEYPDYSANVSLDVCIEDLDLAVGYGSSAALVDDQSGTVEPPTEYRNALLPESREEVNDEIRQSYEEDFRVMLQILEDIDTDGWDGSTDVSGLPADLDSYDEILADPFDGDLQGQVDEVPEQPDTETTTPEVEQERTLDYTTTPDPEETTEVGGPEPGSEERFLYAYYSAASNRDWFFTYSALSDDSKNLFTEEEWREAQDARIAQSGGSAPLQDLEILGLIGDAAGATADVELTFEDGTQETVADVGISVEGEQFKRDLTPDEVAYLESLLEDDTSTNPECGILGCPDENGEYTSGPPLE